jgi:lysine decarboxylase/arginine decarboxylase
MQHGQGRTLMQDAIEEAITFRRKMSEIHSCMAKEKDGWWFDMFQPPGIEDQPFSHATAPLISPQEKGEDVTSDTSFWLLESNAPWHGYGSLKDNFVMLDPIKVTIMTPGLDVEGNWHHWGIPAALVSLFLRQKGIVVEKTGNYALLVLFSLGISRGKSGTLLSELFQLKEHYDRNELLDDVLPDLVEQYPRRYRDTTFRDLANEMHTFLRNSDAAAVSADVYGTLPEQVMLPSDAFTAMVSGRVDRIPLAESDGRSAAVMIVPYPPGIPVIMPGERIDSVRTPLLLKFLNILADFDSRFPGFEHEVHGVEAVRDDATGQVHYEVDCVCE